MVAGVTALPALMAASTPGTYCVALARSSCFGVAMLSMANLKLAKVNDQKG